MAEQLETNKCRSKVRSMTRRYYYHVMDNVLEGTKYWHLYVHANRCFSMVEMLAKQHWILAHIDALPFNNITFKTASCRESTQAIQPIIPEPNITAFHCDEITLDKIAHVISWDYDFVLEFVFTDEKHVLPFLEFLQKHWHGQWVSE
jgi:hypothetical protein